MHQVPSRANLPHLNSNIITRLHHNHVLFFVVNNMFTGVDQRLKRKENKPKTQRRGRKRCPVDGCQVTVIHLPRHLRQFFMSNVSGGEDLPVPVDVFPSSEDSTDNESPQTHRGEDLHIPADVFPSSEVSFYNNSPITNENTPQIQSTSEVFIQPEQ